MSLNMQKSENFSALWSRIFSGSAINITIFTIILFLVSPIFAPGTLSSASLLSMIPFASVLAIATVGQTLVIQQRGLDLSVPGQMALGAVFGTCLTQNYNWPIWSAVLVGILVPGLFGILSGVFVSIFKVVPIIITLGMNSVLIGFVFFFSGGTPAGAANGLNQFALAKSWGIPNTFLIAIALVILVTIITQRTIIGRKLRNIGVSERTALVLGHQVTRYKIIAYGFAGLCYGAAGVLLAAYIKTPNLFVGDTYLLPSVAAVVLGGSALAGGISSVLASSVAALFLTQLGQVLRSVGWPNSSQYIAQAVVLIIVVVSRELIVMTKQRNLLKKLA